MTLPKLAGLLRLDSTKLLKWAWETRRSVSAARCFAVTQRSLEAGSSGRSWRRASRRSATASRSSGSRAHGFASGLAPRGMDFRLAARMASVNRVVRLWAVACGGSAPERAASQSARNATQSALWNAHLGFLTVRSPAGVALVVSSIGRWSLPRSRQTLQVVRRARVRLQTATSGAELPPDR